MFGSVSIVACSWQFIFGYGSVRCADCLCGDDKFWEHCVVDGQYPVVMLCDVFCGCQEWFLQIEDFCERGWKFVGCVVDGEGARRSRGLSRHSDGLAVPTGQVEHALHNSWLAWVVRWRYWW